MASYAQAQFFLAHRCLVRVSSALRDWETVPLTRLESVEGGLKLSCGASPDRSLAQVVGADERGIIATRLEIWRVARGVVDKPPLLRRDRFDYEGFYALPYDIDAGSYKLPLEHVVLTGLRKMLTTDYTPETMPKSMPLEIQELFRWVQTVVPAEPGDYEVYFRHEDHEFSRNGSFCLLHLEQVESADHPTRFKVVMSLAGVELPATSNREADAMQRTGSQGVLVVEGDVCEHVVAEALYTARMRTGRVIDSIIKV